MWLRLFAMLELPIHAVLPDVLDHLASRDELVLQAAPGAGKTTIVPLALLDAPWLTGKILLLEPRRMAARAVAYRMSELLNEPVGQRVGYRVRQDTKTGPRTRIEVVTSGVLLNILQDDPSLEEYSLIIFDEFHERSVDSDFGLTLCLHARELMRDELTPLKILVMSATLDDKRVAEFLNDAPVVRSDGRSYPVDIQYLGECHKERIVEEMASAIQSAHANHQGDILAFLPGKKEIQRCAKRLIGKFSTQTAIYPLHGSLPLEQQFKAIQPLGDDSSITRKIVLATDIAETSLTIEGISVVVDSCLHRTPLFDSKTGMSRLTTRRCSRDSITQRAGRAGRLKPGSCYRLLSQSTTLAQHSPVEILQADLTQLVLQMLNFGANHPDELAWLDPPPDSAYNSAISLLVQLGALKQSQDSFILTEHGQQIAQLSTHPRLAHMMIKARDLNATELGCFFAAVLMEPTRPPALSADIEHWAEYVDAQKVQDTTTKRYLNRVTQQQRQFLQKLALLSRSQQPKQMPERVAGLLIALAYPDKIGRKRAATTSTYQMANGRAAVLANPHQGAHGEWLAVAETGGQQGRTEDQIYLAAPLSRGDINVFLADTIQTRSVLQWSEQSGRFIAEEQKYLGHLLLASKRLEELPPQVKQSALAGFIKEKGLHILNWPESCRQLIHRVTTVRNISSRYADTYPDFSSAALLQQIDEWLTPYLGDVKTLRDLQQLDLLSALQAYLGWPKFNELNALAPERLEVPSGFSAPVDYSQSPPALQVKLQEMFGCTETPSIANGALTLTVHLLSPAGRPLQVTQDLKGFWQGSYHEVKKQMKGRYPKHPWPDDPLTTPATRFTKRV